MATKFYKFDLNSKEYRGSTWLAEGYTVRNMGLTEVPPGLQIEVDKEPGYFDEINQEWVPDPLTDPLAE